MTEARYEDVWKYVSLRRDVLPRWEVLRTRLGRRRGMWELLVDGWRRAGLEAVLAEAQETLLRWCDSSIDPDVLCEDVVAAHAAFVARVEAGIRRAEREERAAEARIPIGVRVDGVAKVRDAEDPLPTTTTPRGIDRCIRGLADESAARDLYFGGVAAKLLAARGWRVLGYPSETQYASGSACLARRCARK